MRRMSSKMIQISVSSGESRMYQEHWLANGELRRHFPFGRTSLDFDSVWKREDRENPLQGHLEWKLMLGIHNGSWEEREMALLLGTRVPGCVGGSRLTSRDRKDTNYEQKIAKMSSQEIWHSLERISKLWPWPSVLHGASQTKPDLRKTQLKNP